MKVFHMDMDNTIIYSYKHEIGEKKRAVELYQGREISFITEKTYELLQAVKEKVLMVPTSTRTIEQYNRIRLGVGEFPYALVCNGGILLVNGERDDAWYTQSLKLIRESEEELQKAIDLLQADERRNFELRFIEELFVFTKCEQPEAVVGELSKILDTSKVSVFHNGVKVYVVPRKLSKGIAVERFRNYIGADKVFAAGDSEFDISMLQTADCGYAPYDFCNAYHVKAAECRGVIEEAKKDELLSEFALQALLINS